MTATTSVPTKQPFRALIKARGEYEPDLPSLREYRAGFWATAYPGFEVAALHWGQLFTAYGCKSSDAVDLGIRWAIRHGYYPDGYRRRSVTSDRIADIKARVPVEIAAARLTELRGSGKSLVGKCPFHDDRHPSFVVWPEIGKFRCYGCGEHGDVIDLLRKARMDD